MYEEQLYKEVVYDTRADASEKEEHRDMNPLMRARRDGSGKIRNLAEFAKQASELVTAPVHPRKKTPFKHIHPEVDKN